ncbi:MAG: ion channel [Thiohalophilus sp.]|jgi:hypothetical protein
MTGLLKRVFYQDEPQYLAFMLSLVLLLVGQSAFEPTGLVARLIDITFLILFITTFFAVWHNLWMLILVVLLGLPMFGFRVLVTIFDVTPFTTVGYAFGALFFGFMFVSIIYHILMTSRVTRNTIYGAVAAYLLIGISFAFVYGIVLQFEPDSMAIPEIPGIEMISLREAFNILTYYSFTSLTTLGFGDISPVLPLVRTLSYLEAALGQLYLTILIARLVGLHISGGHSGSK